MERVESVEVFELSPSAEGTSVLLVGDYRQPHCPICFEAFVAENPGIIFACHHVFHCQCVESWRQRSNRCPVCLVGFVGDGHVMTPADIRRAHVPVGIVVAQPTDRSDDKAPLISPTMPKEVPEACTDDEPPVRCQWLRSLMMLFR